MSRSAHDIAGFVDHVLCEGRERYRDFPWRHTRDPYAILVSEVMLQQTQVSRVVAYYETWMADFPSLEALAAAPLEAVLERWQGLGYNRRAIAMKRLAEKVVGDARAGKTHARLPATDAELRALPGVGPSTAAGVRAFAFGEPAAYLETNVRSVVLHELLPDVDEVPDREVRLLVEEAAQEAARRGVEPRVWNYALLDYGAYLKRAVPNPSRRSAHHARQSAFEGSRRQARAKLLRAVMAAPGLSAGDYGGTDIPAATELLEQLATEGFLTCEDGRWFVA